MSEIPSASAPSALASPSRSSPSATTRSTPNAARTTSVAHWFIVPAATYHGPGHDPYTVRDLATDDERRTSFRGVTKDPGT